MTMRGIKVAGYIPTVSSLLVVGAMAALAGCAGKGSADPILSNTAQVPATSSDAG
jgi:hypothetical protein